MNKQALLASAVAGAISALIANVVAGQIHPEKPTYKL